MPIRNEGTISPIRPVRMDGDDEVLLAELKDGQPRAFDELFDRYSDHVRRVTIRIVGMDSDLPDLINEVFLQVLRSVHSVREGQKLKAWISRLTVFYCRNWIRNKRRRRWLVFKPDHELPPQPYCYHLDEESSDLLRDIRCVLFKLSTMERIVFTLRFYEELKIREIADVCDVSHSTAKRLLKKSECRFKSEALNFPALKEKLDLSEKWSAR